MAAEQRRERGPAAGIGHMQDVGPAQVLEPFGGEMGRPAEAAARIGILAGRGAHERDQLGHARRGDIGTHHQHIGKRAHQRYRVEVAHRIETQIAAQMRKQRRGGTRRDQQRVAVGRGLGGERRAGGAGGARRILDDDRPVPALCESLGNHARDNVGRAARRERHDDTDGALGIGRGRALRGRICAEQRQTQ